MTDGNVKILVTDDSAFMRKFIGGYLQEAGFRDIIEAGNGAIALKKYDEEHPDVVFLDLIMPVRDGMDTLDDLVRKGARVIVVSAVGQKTVMERALARGARGFFIKPFFTVEGLASKVREVISDS